MLIVILFGNFVAENASILQNHTMVCISQTGQERNTDFSLESEIDIEDHHDLSDEYMIISDNAIFEVQEFIFTLNCHYNILSNSSKIWQPPKYS